MNTRACCIALAASVLYGVTGHAETRLLCSVDRVQTHRSQPVQLMVAVFSDVPLDGFRVTFPLPCFDGTDRIVGPETVLPEDCVPAGWRGRAIPFCVAYKWWLYPGEASSIEIAPITVLIGDISLEAPNQRIQVGD